MELKEYIQIFKKKKEFFLGVWLSVILAVLLVFIFLPVKYETVMSIAVTREGDANIFGEYDYDLYYRLEADDSYGKTVVQWLSDENNLNEILSRSRDDCKIDKSASHKIAKSFRGEQFSANYIHVKYKTENISQAQALAKETSRVLKVKNGELNESSQNDNWFKLIFSQPSITKKELPLSIIFGGAIILGLLVSIFITMFSHYWQSEK